LKNYTVLSIFGAILLYFGLPLGVTIKDTTFKDVQGKENTGWFIETKTAKWLFEAGKQRSGFGGLWSNDGMDWLQCFSGPGTARNRGFPNSIGNFGHANRASGAKNTVRDGKMSGDHLIIDAENKNLHFAYHIFEDHLAVEVVKANTGYHFLYEATAGGSIYVKYWTADGKEAKVNPDKYDQDLTPEWIYLTDKEEKCKYKLLMVKTPDDDFPNEQWQQGKNMSGFSWGRHGRSKKWKGGFLTGLDHKISVAMIPAETPYEEIKKMAETLSSNHLVPMSSPTSKKVSRCSAVRKIEKPDIVSLGSSRYQIRVPSTIERIEMVNTRGVVISRLYNSSAENIIWNGAAFSSGAYLLYTISKEGSITSKFMVKK
jgi:hypothetical protein